MERVNRILTHSQYQKCINEIQSLETDRKFCGHTMEHFLDVARLTYILVLEEGLEIDKEVVYAASLLHDIGRHLEYTKGIPHQQASVEIGAGILEACGYSKEEQRMILEAIEGHRRIQEAGGFPGVLYRADKLSRNCFSCKVCGDCNWPDTKKNMRIQY